MKESILFAEICSNTAVRKIWNYFCFSSFLHFPLCYTLCTSLLKAWFWCQSVFVILIMNKQGGKTSFYAWSCSLMSSLLWSLKNYYSLFRKSGLISCEINNVRTWSERLPNYLRFFQGMGIGKLCRTMTSNLVARSYSRTILIVLEC